MAHITEEGGLCTVQLGQGLGAFSLFLICSGIGHSGPDLARHQVEEPAIGVIKGPSWTDPSTSAPVGLFRPGLMMGRTIA